MKNKRWLFWMLAVMFVFSSLFAGCASGNQTKTTNSNIGITDQTDAGEADTVTLKLVMDYSIVSHPEKYLPDVLLPGLIENYQQTHQNVRIEVEYLPTDPSELEIALQNMRTAILAGRGPDMFLMSTGNIRSAGSLFKNVTTAMRNGLFLDISEQYDADDALNKEELNSKVMEAGVWEGTRYVLPLAYEMPVLQINEEALADYGLTPEDISGSLSDLMTAVDASDDPLFQVGLDMPLFNSVLRRLEPFGQIADYKTEEILLDADTLAQHLQFLQRLIPINNIDYTERYGMDFVPLGQTNIVNYLVGHEGYWYESGMPYHVDNLMGAYDSEILRLADGGSYSVYPLELLDGNVTAKVTYWAAVGSSCDYPQEAYEFLRELLTPEVQWSRVHTSQTTLFEGYPVRNQGAAEKLLLNEKRRVNSSLRSGTDEVEQRLERITAVQEEDMQFAPGDWEEEIDNVIFPSDLELSASDLMNQIIGYDQEAGEYIALEVDTAALAEEFLREVRFLLAES